MQRSTPPPDRSVWGPPRGRRIASEPIPARAERPTAGGRRHPAAQARRFAGWATLASAATIVGYMVTADAQQPSSQSVVPTHTANLPTVRPAAPTAAQPHAQLPQLRPISSSHGS